MKVYVKNPPLSAAMNRVTNALVRYGPGSLEHVQQDFAEFVLLHVIGYPEALETIERLRSRGQKFGIAQYCLRSTQRPNTADWLPLWRDAEIVWTYYDLPMLCAEDGQKFDGVNFCWTPLGVDSDVFRPWPVPKKFKIATSGYVAESETVLEAMEACAQLDKRMFHLGPKDERFGEHVFANHGISDGVLAQMYSRCEYVAGLRRAEGFELPAAEGLLCGARPVCFDRPHYRKWYGEFAEFIPESSSEETVKSLVEVFGRDARAVTKEERAAAAELFNWERVAATFWTHLGVRTTKVKRVAAKRSILVIGDAVVSTGFSRSTHEICDRLDNYDVHVLGLNYWGDPHDKKYPIYPTRSVSAPDGDYLGIRRLPEIISKVRPDLVVIQNDPWHFPGYMRVIGNTPSIGIVAVDGMNCRGNELNGLLHAIFWTEFGRREAHRGGYMGQSSVVPLGVDLDVYKPMDRVTARRALGIPERFHDAFIVGNVNRNQPRKRLDLTISFFAEWVKSHNVQDAYLYLHIAPTKEVGYDADQLMQYYGLSSRLIYCEPEVGRGVSEQQVAFTHAACDIEMSTTQGEGFGLQAIEAFACGRPYVAPDWSALGDWARDAAVLIPCVEIACTQQGINAIGAIPSRVHFIAALDKLYREPVLREEHAQKGLALVAQPQFRWVNIAAQVERVIDISLSARVEDEVAVH